MNKRVLIISPYFAPVNMADMHRVRMSLLYYAENGWDAEVVMVDERYTDANIDPLLNQSVPAGIKIHKVKALKKSWTSKLGLGSIALRSLWFYKQKVNQLLEDGKYDLVYFSTTQFPVCVLGAYWKKRYKIPYVIDMQDPWHSDYYQDKPKSERPNKYWFSYRLNRYLEPRAMKHADGLIAVSKDYIHTLKKQYPGIAGIPEATITFGAFAPDLKIAIQHQGRFEPLLRPEFVNIVYTGRGGADMHRAITPLFEALNKGLNENPLLFKKLRIYFIGTSYAPGGQGVPTIAPLAGKYEVENSVIEITDRIAYYHALQTLQQADALFIPGSDSQQYTASKIYPYLLTQKPLMAIFNKAGSAVEIIRQCAEHAIVLTFDQNNLADQVYQQLVRWAEGSFKPVKLLKSFERYSAQTLTERQTDLFNQVIN